MYLIKKSILDWKIFFNTDKNFLYDALIKQPCKQLSYFALFFIFSDFLIIVLSYKYIGDLFTLVHHAMAIWAYYFVVVSLLISWA